MSGIGVFVCECGPNIGDRVNVDELVAFARSLENVSHSAAYRLACSEEGKRALAQEILDRKLSRLVIAGCSPREHEKTFRDVCRQAGLNPYLLQIVNIREQCAWVISDKSQATSKAKALLRAAVARVLRHESLQPHAIECQGDVLVVGAGVAGMEAALTLAQKDRKVFLVEKSPYIGGKAVLYEEAFPNMDCATCMLEPKMDQVMHSDNIVLLTLSEVEDVKGFCGNFTIRIRRKARCVDEHACIGCGECSRACKVTVPNQYNEALNARNAVSVPYPGALPNVAWVDRDACLRSRGEDCKACAEACPFAAIRLDESDETLDVEVGAVVLAPGFELFDCRRVPNLRYGEVPEVYTSLEFERLLSATGPTGGKLLTKGGKTPTSIAIVHCIGSRSEEHCDYCSGVCCMASLKLALLAKTRQPELQVFDIHRNLTLPGKRYTAIYRDLQHSQVSFVRAADTNAIRIEPEGEGCSLEVPTKGETISLRADMVVLSPAMRPPRDAVRLAELFGVSLDAYGFFQEEHNRLGPVSTTVAGVYIAGCAQGPKDIQSSCAQGAAAAGKVLHKLVKGERIELESITAFCDDGTCGACKTCLSVCPYKAISFDVEAKKVSVNEALCHGCGTCAAACPSGAMQAHHFTGSQIAAEIEALTA